MYNSEITIPVGGGAQIIYWRYPMPLSVVVNGNVTLAANASIVLDPAVTPRENMTILINWEANVVLNGNTMDVLGTLLTQDQCSNLGVFHCRYDGAAWVVKRFVDRPQQVADTTVERATLPAGAVIQLDPAQDSAYQVITGAGNLLAGITVSPIGTPQDADEFQIDYRATYTNGGGTVTIFGVTLTDAQMLAGNVTVRAKYNLWSVAWLTSVWEDRQGLVDMWEPGSAGTESCTRLTALTGCDATGNYAVAEGRNTLASGVDSHSEGVGTVSSGVASHSEGAGSVASAPHAHAEGSTTTASGQNSHSEGQTTVASNTAAHAEGNGTTASGIYSHSEGHNTLASSDSSHAEGNATISKSFATHAEGDRSVAPYYASSALGWNSFIATGDCQRVLAGLSKVTTDALPHYLTDVTGATGLTIPTDCTAKVKVQVTAVQVGGGAGTIGDSFSQEIWFTVKDIAGALTMETTTRATTAGICTVAANVTYFDADKTAAFGGTVVPDLIGNELRIEVNGEANKDINWSCLIELVWVGYRNFVV